MAEETLAIAYEGDLQLIQEVVSPNQKVGIFIRSELVMQLSRNP